MSQFNSLDEVLDFAIKGEEEAANFYDEMAEKTTAPAMKKAFKGYAQEERGHKHKLETVKNGGKFISSYKKIPDLKIADYLVEKQPSSDMSYQDVLIILMQKEKAAYRLYTQLGEDTEDPTMKSLFLGLANEEAKHKLRFETEYDNAMGDN